MPPPRGVEDVEIRQPPDGLEVVAVEDGDACKVVDGDLRGVPADPDDLVSDLERSLLQDAEVDPPAAALGEFPHDPRVRKPEAQLEAGKARRGGLQLGPTHAEGIADANAS